VHKQGSRVMVWDLDKVQDCENEGAHVQGLGNHPALKCYQWCNPGRMRPRQVYQDIEILGTEISQIPQTL